MSLKVPDRSGKVENVVLGYEKLEDFERGRLYFGGTIGRYANRIAHARFTIGQIDYVLPMNNGDNTLDGGIRGFDKRVWMATDVSSDSQQAVEFTYPSEDGEEGFPGNLTVTVVFAVPCDRNELHIDYVAATRGKDTFLNLTRHSYFNLARAGNGDILGHQLMVRANRFTPIDATQVPTGELRDVAGTPFDFRRANPIGERIDENCAQLNFAGGYDHNFVLDHIAPGSLDLAADAYDPSSGRVFQVFTTEPGMQFYSGTFLGGPIQGKGGGAYGYRGAFCLETQHFPDSPNI